MWIVYNRDTTWQHGFEVKTELEAIEYCRTYVGYTYIYVGEWRI